MRDEFSIVRLLWIQDFVSSNDMPSLHDMISSTREAVIENDFWNLAKVKEEDG